MITLTITCQECGHQWEQSTDKTEVTLECPNCKEEVRKE